MQLVDGSAISDPDIREVYCRDIIHMSRQVQAKQGLMVFLYEGDLSNVTGFYHFRIFSLEKHHPSEK
jgi:hypothetical protein